MMVPAFLVLIGGLEWLGWSTGETYTPRALARALDQNPNFVWMPLRIQAAAALKLGMVDEERPDILLMGHSRLQEVKPAIFRPYSAYNLAAVMWPFNTYTDLLFHLPDGYRPKIIFFTVDFFMFGSKYDEHFRAIAPVYGHGLSENIYHLHDVLASLSLAPDLFWRRTDKSGRPALGIGALEGRPVFVKDGTGLGSLKMMSVAGTSPDALMNDGWKDGVTGGDKMGASEMADLKAFVDLGRKMGIVMVAVQMPIYGPVLRSMERDPQYAILKDFQSHEANGYFASIGLPFFDYLKFLPFSEDYHYFIDPLHPGQPLSAAVIAAMASDPRIHSALPRLDIEELHRQFDEQRSWSQHILLN